MYLGDFAEDGDIFFKFTTRAFATGIPTTLAGTPVLSVYKDEGGAATEKTTAETYFDLDVDHDSITGWHNVRVDLSGDAFFATGADYSIVITTGTVDSVNVFGENLANFSIENRSMGQPAGATLAADVAALKTVGDAIQTETDKLTFTVANQLDTNPLSWSGGLIPAQGVTGVPEVDVTHHTAGIAPTPATTGVPDVNTVEFLDVAVAAATASGEVNSNVTEWIGTAVTLGGGAPDVNIASTDNIALGAQQKLDVNTEVDNSMVTYGLDHLVFVSVTGTDIADNSIIAKMVDDAATADWDGYDNQTASLEALNVDTDAIKVETNSLDGTKIPQTLNLTASGNIGVDWANVENPTTALDLSGTDIQLVDTATTVTNEVTADITKIGGSSTAADKLEEGAEALAIGTVNDASATTTDFIITLTGDTVDATDDHYNGRIITFTTGILLQQSTDILDYTGSTKSVNVTALTEAPGNGDQFVIS